jgi:anthranilate synthase component 1
MTEIEFKALAAQGYNRIPLILETYADLDTPLSIYLKLAHTAAGGGVNSYLLESVVGGERFGRYSFIGLPARIALRSRGHELEVWRDGQCIERHHGDPLAFVQQYFDRFRVALRPGMPRFVGGLAGYFGHDVVRHIEPKLGPCRLPDPPGLGEGVPDMVLVQTDELAVVDNLAGRLYLMVYADPAEPEAYARARQRLRELHQRLHRPVELPYAGASVSTDIQRPFAKADYLAAVLRAKEYIAAGDLMQVQVGQVLAKPFTDSPIALYRALRSLNPSPYMYHWNFGDFQVVGASPEILVRQEALADGQRRVTIRPLAGTRRRGATPDEDAALARELLEDPKEIAEHLMLIDLARNDIGRIAQTGTVKVTDQMVVERYSHVMHIVSNVCGLLKPGLGSLDVLRATFPAGTLSGAPKIRALELIDELEPVRRNVYGGACGYLSYGGEMDVAIAVRTGVIRQGMLHVQAAAGVVADSDPEKEWLETEAKARAVLRAAEQVQFGLDTPY